MEAHQWVDLFQEVLLCITVIVRKVLLARIAKVSCWKYAYGPFNTIPDGLFELPKGGGILARDGNKYFKSYWGIYAAASQKTPCLE